MGRHYVPSCLVFLRCINAGFKVAVSVKDKYVPCILTRLADDNPQSRIDTLDRFVPLEKIRQEIVDNVSVLLNSRSRPQLSDLKYNEEIANSVLGYGITDFCGRSNSIGELNRICDEITHQLKLFEPRLEKGSIKVKILNSDNPRSKSVFALEITGKYAVKALEGEFICISDLDLETGLATVNKGQDNS